jgi:glycosyltransferase involved in cell wall biosynthesis
VPTAISVLMPIYNEALNIEKVILDWLALIPAMPKGSLLEIEDANSKDGTRQILEQIEKKYSGIVNVSYRADRDGFSNSIARLIKNSKNELLFIADSDGQYESSDIFHFLKHVNDEDLLVFVKGIKIWRNDGTVRKVYSRLINLYCSKLFRTEYLDLNSSHYLISKSLINLICPGQTSISNQLKQTKSFSNLSKISANPADEMNYWTFRKLINIEISLRVVLSNFRYEKVYVKHYKRNSGPSRGHPSYRIVKDGLQAIQDIKNLRREFFK